MNNTQMVACPNCGKEQQRLSTIQGEEYIAVCGPTCGCGHKWTVYPEPQTAHAYTDGSQLEADIAIIQTIMDGCDCIFSDGGPDDPKKHNGAAWKRIKAALRGSHDAKAPAQRQCAKCGGVDLHVRFARAGEYEDGIWIGSRKEDVWEPHTGRTDPSRPWDQFWVADSLAITCRTCQYRWVEKPRDAQKVGYFEQGGEQP
jgi:hypothetical protein